VPDYVANLHDLPSRTSYPVRTYSVLHKGIAPAHNPPVSFSHCDICPERPIVQVDHGRIHWLKLLYGYYYCWNVQAQDVLRVYIAWYSIGFTEICGKLKLEHISGVRGTDYGWAQPRL
jgi:hypothetical protein